MAPQILRNLARAGRKNPLAWQYLFNCLPTLSYKINSSVLSKEARRVKDDLNAHGVAMTSVDALLASNRCYPELLEAIQILENDIEEELDTARSSSEDTGAIGRKVFNVELLGRRPTFDGSSVYARFALQQEILDLANSYFGMYTNLRYYNVWHTFATDCAPRESQLWHRDREDFHVLKMFLYVSDVDETSGAFNYVSGTHPKGKRRQLAPYFLEGGVARSNDEQMAEAVSPEHWKKCTGPRGTIIFADTRGYHKGGLARSRDRIMYTCMFTSPASQSEKLLHFPHDMQLPVDKEKRRALRERFR